MLSRYWRGSWMSLARHLVAPLLALVMWGGAVAGEHVPSSDAGIVGRFPIGKNGRPILLPVAIADREILCLLDTGATYSGFDISLRDGLGPSESDIVLQTAAGATNAQTYAWPDARIGTEPISLETPVVCVDLEPIRRAANADIFGFIGMDILKRCRFLVDFDRGIVHFVDSISTNAAKNLGTKIPLQVRADGTPLVVASIPESEAFVIDTGADTTSLRADLFDALLEAGEIQLKSAFSTSTAAGIVRGNQGRLENLTIGVFTHSNLRVSRMHESALGLRYLSRFQVVFDFPGNAMYLRKGAEFDKPEPRATSGLSLLWIDGELCVEAVRDDGPGDRAGLRAGDVLTVVNSRPGNAIDPVDLREMLNAVAGAKVPMTVRRGESELEVELVPSED